MLRKRLLLGLALLLFLGSGVALRIVLPPRIALAAASAPAPLSVPLEPPRTAQEDAPAAIATPTVFGPRSIAVDVNGTDGDGQPFRHVSGEGFPAISRDGTQVAILRQDSEDFTGDPFDTLRFVSASSGKTLASFMVASPALLPATQKARMATAQARLDKTTWRELEWAQTADETDGDWDHILSFPQSDVKIRFAQNEPERLHLEGAIARDVRVDLPPMATLMADDHRSCGSVVGYDGAYLDPGRTIAILVPSANEGGDNCMGRLAIDQLAFVPLR